MRQIANFQPSWIINGKSNDELPISGNSVLVIEIFITSFN